MRSFRQKVFSSYFVILLLFLGLMFPFVTNSVQQIVFRSMSDRADELVKMLEKAQNDEQLVEMLKEQRNQLFYRIGVLDGQRRLLYDSHTKRLSGPSFFPLQFVTQPEIEDALQYGVGYSEDYSFMLGQKLIYVAKRFDFHGQTYVLRLAFPFHHMQDIREGFTIGFLIFGSVVLILFSAMTILVLNHFSNPIKEIIESIRTYQEGNPDTLPHITLKTSPQDDFTHLANTLNSLSQSIKKEIESVTKERNEREAILESLVEGVLAVDSNLTVSYANKTALELLGLDSDVIGKPLSPKLHPKYHRLLEECQKEGKFLVDELEMIREGGTLFLHVVATPRRMDGGALLVLHDKSIHHRIIEMRKAFIANASHELKTPITVIRGFAETLHDHPNLPQETTKQITERILNNCVRMTTMIKNLLTLADIENLPSFRVRSCDLVQLIESIRENHHAVFPDAVVSFHHREPTCMVDVDPGLFEVLIMNLLDNAAKYSVPPALIDIRLIEDASNVMLQIEDHGIGIPEADLENIFQRFYRVNKAHSTRLGGSGLGLSIVETIISKHLGEISVSSTLGKGTTFIIVIPRDLAMKLALLEQENN